MELTELELRRFLSSSVGLAEAVGRPLEAVDALLLDRLSLVINAGPSVFEKVLNAGEAEIGLLAGDTEFTESPDVSLFEFGIVMAGAPLFWSCAGEEVVGDEEGEPLSLPPNILFKRPPPDEEKLLFGLLASVLTVWRFCLLAHEL